MKRKKQFCLCVAVLFLQLLLLNGALFYTTKCTGEYMQSKNVWGVTQSVKVGDYIRQQQIIGTLPDSPEQALKAVDEIISYLEQSQKKENDIYVKYMETLFGKTWSEPLTEPEDNQYIPEGMVTMGIKASDIENYKQVRKYIKNVVQYKDYVKNVAENAGTIADALFPIHDDAWLLKNLARCQKDYYGLEYTQLEVEPDDTFNLVINYHVTDAFAFLFVLAVVILFCYYKKYDSFGEMHDTRHTAVLMLLTLGIGLLCIYIENFCIADNIYGLPNMSAPLQSLEDFYVCPYSITIGGFMAVYTGIKIVTQLLLSGICILAYTSSRRIPACVLTLSCLAVEYIGNLTVPEKNWAGVFGEINLFSGFTPERFYNRYLNLNVAGMMIPRFQAFLTVFFLAFGIVMLLVYKRFGKWHKKSRQEAMNAYFGEIDKRYQETRLLWHDFNNHLLAIKALYENGHEIQAAKYIDDLSEQSYARLLPAKSGSDTLDLLLFKKHQQANETGVTIRFQFGCSLAGLSVTEYDLCSLFGNILDNAIEAARQVKNTKSEVFLRVEKQNSMLFISCENPYAGALLKQDGELKTTKKDTAKHGIGLSSVKHICKKYNGNLELETKDNVFRVSVLLNV